MIKIFYKELKKNLTKKNIIIFCVAFIFLFSGLLSIMLYGTGKDMLAEYEKSDVVYPENSTEMYREELEDEVEAKVQEVMGKETESDDKITASKPKEDDVTASENYDSVTKSDVEIPKDKNIKDVEQPKNDENLGVDKDKMEEDSARIDEKANTFKSSES